MNWPDAIDLSVWPRVRVIIVTVRDDATGETVRTARIPVRSLDIRLGVHLGVADSRAFQTGIQHSVTVVSRRGVGWVSRVDATGSWTRWADAGVPRLDNVRRWLDGDALTLAERVLEGGEHHASVADILDAADRVGVGAGTLVAVVDALVRAGALRVEFTDRAGELLTGSALLTRGAESPDVRVRYVAMGGAGP